MWEVRLRSANPARGGLGGYSRATDAGRQRLSFGVSTQAQRPRRPIKNGSIYDGTILGFRRLRVHPVPFRLSAKVGGSFLSGFPSRGGRSASLSRGDLQALAVLEEGDRWLRSLPPEMQLPDQTRNGGCSGLTRRGVEKPTPINRRNRSDAPLSSPFSLFESLPGPCARPKG